MRQVMVRYRVKPERVAENEELVCAVYTELADRRPAGLRYATFKLDDGVTFVHIASMADGAGPLSELKSFRQFLDGIEDRCDEPPEPSTLTRVGAYEQ